MKFKLDKKGSEEFHTALNLLIGSIFFVVVTVIIMFLFVGEDIQATFDAGYSDVDKIATRIIFTETCLALVEETEFTWYEDTDYRKENRLVRLGTIDVSKFEEDRISQCAGYSITNNYTYTITYTNLDTGANDTITPTEGDVTNCGDSRVRIDKEKIYPVIIYDGDYHNGKIEMRIEFCYETESVK